MLWMFWALGCATKDTPVAAADDGIERLRVRAHAAATVDGVEALPGELAALLGGFSVSLDVVVEKTLVREFRDGSLGYRVHFAQADATVAREGTPDAAAPLTLAGRTVELRAFPDGELLNVDLVEHVIGPERMLDVFDLVFPAISPAPPQPLAGTAPQTRAVHWPVRLAREQVMLSSVWARWQLVDRDRDTAQLRYEGPWEVRGRERVGEGSLRLEGAGRLEGELWVRRSDGQLLRHTLSGHRTLSVPYPGAEGLQQTLQVDVEVERL